MALAAKEYDRMWGSAHPGCFIFALDQSGSMAEQFGGEQATAGVSKADAVARILNNVLRELLRSCSKPNAHGIVEIKPRVDVAVLGYSGSSIGVPLPKPLQGNDFVTMPDLQLNPLKVEKVRRKDIDPAGNIFDVEEEIPMWVAPASDGGTPMCMGLKLARELAAQWAAGHPECFPPVVVNVTDGAWTDADPSAEATAIGQVRTNYGSALLFNCHITASAAHKVEFPSRESEVPNDSFARMLFATSALIPETLRTNIKGVTGSPLVPGTRGYIFNGDVVSIRKMLIRGDPVAWGPYDVNPEM